MNSHEPAEVVAKHGGNGALAAVFAWFMGIINWYVSHMSDIGGWLTHIAQIGGLVVMIYSILILRRNYKSGSKSLSLLEPPSKKE